MKYYYVSSFVGTVEGKHYDTVTLSDGLTALSVANQTGSNFDDYKEGDEVIPTFIIKGTKAGKPSVKLTKIAKVGK